MYRATDLYTCSPAGLTKYRTSTTILPHRLNRPATNHWNRTHQFPSPIPNPHNERKRIMTSFNSAKCVNHLRTDRICEAVILCLEILGPLHRQFRPTGLRRPSARPAHPPFRTTLSRQLTHPQRLNLHLRFAQDPIITDCRRLTATTISITTHRITRVSFPCGFCFRSFAYLAEFRFTIE